jgi:hypothetical protein
MARREVVTEEELLKRFPWLNKRRLRQLRLTRRIPYFAPTYRTRLYDPEAVLCALERFEVFEVGAVARRKRNEQNDPKRF